MLERKLKNKTQEQLEDEVLQLLSSGSVSTDTISYILGISSWKANKLLRKLQRWKEVKPITRVSSIVWKKKGVMNGARRMI